MNMDETSRVCASRARNELEQVACVMGGLVFGEGGFAPGEVWIEGATVANDPTATENEAEAANTAGGEYAGEVADANGIAGARAAHGTNDASDTGRTDRATDAMVGSHAPANDAADLVLDATGCYVIPGLIDLHFHGCMGDDLSDASAEGLHRMAAYEASRGVTAICPASMTLPHDKLMAIMANVGAFEADESESELVGMNMEGPYISPDKVGAQNPEFVRGASVEEFHKLQEAAKGRIKLVDVAPEEPGNLDFIAAVAGEVRVSLAHMCADYDCAKQAFAAGARHMTHLFNAMPPLHHRKPGPIVAGSETPDVTPEVIADGVHVHPAMVRLAFELFGDERVIIISDSLRCCGLADGDYELGGQTFSLAGRRCTLPDGTLAGSASDQMACLHTAVLEMGIPLLSAVRAASANPARALGVSHKYGSLTPGHTASLVLLDQDTLEVKHVILRGKLLK